MKQPWIYSASVDGAFILSPALLISAVLLLCAPQLEANGQLAPWMWGVLIIGVDVAHVYSTLYRTYADREEFQARQSLYVLAPLLSWIAGTLLYSISALTFWRAITYLAVFHFVRQQYGFMMIYGRRERSLPPWCRRLDKAAIYGATLYPLIWWHCHAREFNWFVDGDFVSLDLPLLSLIAGIYGTPLTGSAVYVTSSGQLGVLGSSERFKTDIAPMPELSDKLKRLRPVTFRYKTDPQAIPQYGLIAEEVAQVYPELVIRDETGKIQGVRYEELAPMLLNEMQQQAAEIRGLKQQVAKMNYLQLEMRAALVALKSKDQLVARR